MNNPIPASPALSVESEYVLVPREPSEAMLRDGVMAWTMPWADVIPQDIDEDRYILAAVYRAMIAATPAPSPSPAAKGGEAEAIERLKDAVEGECEGLALSDDQALAILAHVALATPSPQQSEAVREDHYYAAISNCLERYHAMAVRAERRDLWEFIEEAQVSVVEHAPLHKLNRWIGYIQGVLIEIGCTGVLEERDWTRPLFRPLDFPTALASDPAPAGEAVEPDDPNLWHFWNEKARWLAAKLATTERERDDAQKALGPFALISENYGAHISDATVVSPLVCLRDLRSARSASREATR